MSTIALTQWANLTNPIGTARAVRFRSVSRWLRRVPRPPHSDAHPGWSPASFVDNKRGKANVQAVSLLCLDLDKGLATIERALAPWAGIEGLWHTTRRSTPDDPRLRVILCLSRSVTVAEHAVLWAWAQARAAEQGVELDSAARDPSRFWFLPPQGAQSGELHGTPVDVDDALEREAIADSAPRPDAVNGDAPRRANGYGAAALDSACGRIATAPKGQRNASLFREAAAIAELVAGGAVVEHVARAALETAALRAGLTEIEVQKTLDSAFATGTQRPRQAPERETRHCGDIPPDDVPRDPEAEQSSEKPPREFTTIEPDAVFAPLEPLEWIIEGIIPAGSIVEIESYGGSGKSWLAVDALVAVATNTAWLGRFPTLHGLTAYLDFENGQREMRRRIQACAHAHEFGSVAGLVLVTMPDIYLTAADAKHALLRLATGRRLIIVDTLRAGVPGLDENDSRMRVPLDLLRAVAEVTGCAFAVLVHSKKTSAAVREVDLREAGRGSSAIYDAADVVLHCALQDGTLKVSCAKSRMGSAFAPFVATIVDGDDGAVQVTATDAPSEDESRSAALDEVTDKVLKFVRARPGCSAKLVREQVGGRASRADVALEILERDGRIRNLGGAGAGKRAAWYPLGPGGRVEGTC